MKSLKDNLHAVMDLSTVIMIGIAFAGLMVVAYIIWTVKDELIPNRPAFTNTNNASNLAWNTSNANANSSVLNVTSGFDSALSLILVAITIFILAIAISALLMLRGRQA